MPPRIRHLLQQELRGGVLHGASPLRSVRGIGPYLEGRLRRALGAGAAAPPTVGDLWRATRRRTTQGVLTLLHRALQNERANQCVLSSRTPGGGGGGGGEGGRGGNAPRGQEQYHVGDINQLGYEACATLLDHARLTGTCATARSRPGSRTAASPASAAPASARPSAREAACAPRTARASGGPRRQRLCGRRARQTGPWGG